MTFQFRFQNREIEGDVETDYGHSPPHSFRDNTRNFLESNSRLNPVSLQVFISQTINPTGSGRHGNARIDDPVKRRILAVYPTYQRHRSDTVTRRKDTGRFRVETQDFLMKPGGIHVIHFIHSQSLSHTLEAKIPSLSDVDSSGLPR